MATGSCFPVSVSCFCFSDFWSPLFQANPAIVEQLIDNQLIKTLPVFRHRKKPEENPQFASGEFYENRYLVNLVIVSLSNNEFAE